MVTVVQFSNLSFSEEDAVDEDLNAKDDSTNGTSLWKTYC